MGFIIVDKVVCIVGVVLEVGASRVLMVWYDTVSILTGDQDDLWINSGGVVGTKSNSFIMMDDDFNFIINYNRNGVCHTIYLDLCTEAGYIVISMVHQ